MYGDALKMLSELRRLTPEEEEIEFPDIVHEVRVTVELSAYIAPPYCTSEHHSYKQPSKQIHHNRVNRDLNLLLAPHSTHRSTHSPPPVRREALSTSIGAPIARVIE
jgi:hypothetical protein